MAIDPGVIAPPRRRADAERNRRRILDVARGLLADAPETSIVDVARAAGLSRKSVYAHFPGRDELIVALFEDVLATMAVAIADSRLDEGPPDEALRRLALTMSEFGRRFSDLHPLFERTLGCDAMSGRKAFVEAAVLELIARGQASGDFRDDVPPRWALQLLPAIGMAARRAVQAGDLAPSEAAERAANTMLAILRPV